MRITGDAYFDGADLMDLEVISTLGITEDDIEAFEEIEAWNWRKVPTARIFCVIPRTGSTYFM